MLAPVRNARKTAGKTTAGSAGLVVSRHEDYVVGDAGAVRFRRPGASLQGGYPPHAVLSHRSDEGHRGVVTGWTARPARWFSERLTSLAEVSAGFSWSA